MSATGASPYDAADASVPLRFALGGGLAALADALIFAPQSVLAALAMPMVLGVLMGWGLQQARRAPAWLVPTLASALGLAVAVQLGALDKWHIRPWASLSAMLALPVLCGLTALICTSALREGGRVPGLILGVLAGSCVGALRTAPTLQSYPALGAVVAVTQLASAGSAMVVLTPAMRMAPRMRRVAVGGLCVLFGGLAAAPASAFAGISSSCANEFALTLVRALSDADGDGASSLFGGQDCAPWQATIGPYAHDLPGDGIDQNCVGGDARVAAATTSSMTSRAASPSGRSVLLITVDTVRYASTSLGRDDRDTTPALARFASENTQFTRAYAAGSWTSISLGCLTRGRSARALTWRKVYETDAMELRDDRTAPPGQTIWSGFFVVDDPAPTFAQIARDAGVRTRAVVDAGPSGFFGPRAGLQQGFDEFDVRAGVADVEIARAAASWLSDTAEPQLVWAHFFGPHLPSTFHEGMATYGSSVRDRYDHELLAFDAALDALLDDVPDDWLVILTADHGEAIGPFGRSHGFDLTDELLHVPLVVSGPGFEAELRSDVVGHEHLAPTMLAALLDTDDPRGLRHAQTGAIFADTWKLDRHGQATLDLAAAIDDEGMVVRDLLTGEQRGNSSGLRDALDAYLNGPSVVAGRVLW